MPLRRLLALLILFGLFKDLKIARMSYLRYLRVLEKRYYIQLRVSGISIKLFGGLKMSGVQLRIKGFAIKIDQFSVRFNIVGMVKNGLMDSISPEFSGMSIERAKPITQAQNTTAQRRNSTANWNQKFFTYLRKFENCLFRRQIKLTFFNLQINLNQISLNFEKLGLSDGRMIFDFTVQRNKETVATYHGNGSVDQKNKKFTFKIIKDGTSSSKLKFLFDEFELILCQKQLETEIRSELEIGFANLQISDERLSLHVLNIDSVYLYTNLVSRPNQLLISKESGGSIGDVPFAFSFEHQYRENDILIFGTSVELSQSLLNSFLTFQNRELHQIKVDGKLTLDFQLQLNITDPLESHFSFSVLDNSLQINDHGDFDLSFLNNSLNYIKEYPLTTQNLLSRKLKSEVSKEQVSEDFLKVIVATEDAFFYVHHGINLDSMGNAIVSNIAKKTFSRGASTITMQLTRNLFLDSDKNVARKIEEIIISLIIENHFMISKIRILEIYINIIEFGPGVYGIDQASNYYFNKSPKQLTLTEAIVLSYMVPRPKHFHEALLIKTPQLLKNLPEYFIQISTYLFQKRLISEQDYKTLDTEIRFAGKLGKIALQPTNNT